ncbi:hypothetical protein [Vagococcus penaei]|nr:hypothetical protein [Vagococcus penaei]
MKKFHQGAINMVITADYWEKSEKLVHTWFSVGLMVISVILLLLFFAAMYSHGNWRKRCMLGIVVISALSVVTVFIGKYYVNDYLAVAKNANLVNRQVEWRPNGYHYIGDRRGSKVLMVDIERTSRLPFYQVENEKLTNVTYLGSDDYRYFLKIKNYIYGVSKKESRVKVSDTTNQVIIKREWAKLTDDSFEKIGFLPKIGPAIEEVIIPSISESKSYNPGMKVYDLPL